MQVKSGEWCRSGGIGRHTWLGCLVPRYPVEPCPIARERVARGNLGSVGGRRGVRVAREAKRIREISSRWPGSYKIPSLPGQVRGIRAGARCSVARTRRPHGAAARTRVSLAQPSRRSGAGSNPAFGTSQRRVLPPRRRVETGAPGDRCCRRRRAEETGARRRVPPKRPRLG